MELHRRGSEINGKERERDRDGQANRQFDRPTDRLNKLREEDGRQRDVLG
jgi:hypothetical protein